MVEVASSNLVTPTKFESPNLYDWGFFYARDIRAGTHCTSCNCTSFYSISITRKKTVCPNCAQAVPALKPLTHKPLNFYLYSTFSNPDLLHQEHIQIYLQLQLLKTRIAYQ